MTQVFCITDKPLPSEIRLGGPLDVDEYCKLRGWWMLEIQPLAGELGLTDSMGRIYEQAREWVACMENVQVIADGFLVTDDGVMTRGLTSSNYSAAIHHYLRGYSERLEASSVIPEAILCWGRSNFGHWLWQSLARLTLMRNKDVPVLIDAKVPKRYHDWVAGLGFKVVTGSDWVRVEKLWVPSVVNYRGHYEDDWCYVSPRSIKSLRKSLCQSGKPHRKLYLSRGKATTRQVLNEKDVLETLKDFEILDLSTLSMNEQLKCVGEAKTIVLPCGGGSPITMFAPETCAILELNNGFLQGDFGSRAWAQVIGQKFWRLDGEAVEGGKKMDRDYTINIEELKEKLKETE